MPPMEVNANPIQNFITELSLSSEATGYKPAQVQFVTADQETAKLLIQRILPNAKLTMQDGKSAAVYHPQVNGGKRPCGSTGPWITNEGFDVESTVEAQLNRERQAA